MYFLWEIDMLSLNQHIMDRNIKLYRYAIAGWIKPDSLWGGKLPLRPMYHLLHFNHPIPSQQKAGDFLLFLVSQRHSIARQAQPPAGKLFLPACWTVKLTSFNREAKECLKDALPTFQDKKWKHKRPLLIKSLKVPQTTMKAEPIHMPQAPQPQKGPP